MLCPNCDGILSLAGCQGCGWKHGDPFPAHRLAPGSAHPLKAGANMYPEYGGNVAAVPIVAADPGNAPQVSAVAAQVPGTSQVEAEIVPPVTGTADPVKAPKKTKADSDPTVN